MSHIPSPFYFRNGRKRKDFRNGVLTYLWIIARDTEEIKEMLQKENEPSDLMNAIERYHKEFVHELETNLLGKKATHDKHEGTLD